MGLAGLEVLAILVLIFCVIAAAIFCTKRWWIKYWKRFRGIRDPEPEIPAATFEPPWYNSRRDSVTFNGIPVQLPIIAPRQSTPPPISAAGSQPTISQIGINNSTSGGIVRVPLPDETNSYAHDWFSTGARYDNINRSNIEYIKHVGDGWFGKVIEARIKNLKPFNDPEAPTEAIVKQLSEDASDADQIRFLHEARLYRDGNNKNLLKLLGFSIERTPYILIFEKWPLGDLKSFLRHYMAQTYTVDGQLDFSILIRMAIDIARALEWMEGLEFVHGDLSARNCLVGNTAGRVIIGDYGLGPYKYREDYYWSSVTCIPIRWSAPETMSVTMNTIITSKITFKSNIWTFGILLWEILELGKQPYPYLTDEQVLDQVITGKTYVLEQPNNPLINESIREKVYRNIMLPCLSYNPDGRPNISTVLIALNTP